jgi:TolB protein
MKKRLWLAALFLACNPKEDPKTAIDIKPVDPDAETAKDWKNTAETHFGDVTQLTFEGDNGEAYFSPNGKQLVFQSTRGQDQFDQIYTMNLDGSAQTKLSSGIGRTSCAYFTADNKSIIYASTHLRPETPPKPAGHSAASYQWAFDTAFDIFKMDLTSKQLTRLTTADGYDAEDVYHTASNKIYFTSMRDGDAEIYVMNADGSDQKRLTNVKGYDGGPWPSPDGKKLVWRASRTEDYRQLHVFVADIDGQNPKQLTTVGTNFAPSWDPTGQWIVFSSDMAQKYNFELYRIRPDGTGLEQITHQAGFDGFPVFSPDGQWLVFSSDRADPKFADPQVSHDTHVFRAKWVP